jgi:hypothetical protein
MHHAVRKDCGGCEEQADGLIAAEAEALGLARVCGALLLVKRF